ncbi:hypothetical protein ACQPXT_02240 [Streptomyces sp. CA-100214]
MEHGEQTRRRAVPGAVVAAGVVGALGVAALVLRPADGLLRSGQGPLGHWGIVAIGSSVAWAVGSCSPSSGCAPGSRPTADR